MATLNSRLIVVHHNNDGKILDLWFWTKSSAREASWSHRYAIPYDAIMPNDSDRDVEPLWEMADERVAVWVWGSFSSTEEGQQGHLRMYDPTENKCVDVLKMSNLGREAMTDDTGSC